MKGRLFLQLSFWSPEVYRLPVLNIDQPWLLVFLVSVWCHSYPGKGKHNEIWQKNKWIEMPEAGFLVVRRTTLFTMCGCSLCICASMCIVPGTSFSLILFFDQLLLYNQRLHTHICTKNINWLNKFLHFILFALANIFWRMTYITQVMIFINITKKDVFSILYVQMFTSNTKCWH